MPDRDWIEIVAKAVLPRPLRLRIRQYRDQRRFKQLVCPSDVFLVGHPKSGNTWTAYMIALLLAKHERNHVTLNNIRTFVPYLKGRDMRIAEHPSRVTPRVFREECPLHPDLYPFTIYLLRDPRAVLLSLYHMYRIACNDETLSLGAFVNDYLTGSDRFRRWYPQLQRWDHHVRPWLTRKRPSAPVLVVRYEDLVRDRRSTLERIVKFSGVACGPEGIEVAVKRGSFEAMQEMENKHGVEAYTPEMSLRGRFIRQGKADSWQEEMNRDIVSQIETELGSTMELAGYL